MSKATVDQIIFSLRSVMETELAITESQMIYDGAKTSDIAKPFTTIQYLMTNSTVLAAGRRSYQHAYRFQVGVYAESFIDLLRLQERTREVVANAEGIPLFGSDFLPTGDSIVCEVSDFTPIANGDISNTTNNHHGYFDVSVFVLRKNGDENFTQ